jgi:hypothetical protein
MLSEAGISGFIAYAAILGWMSSERIPIEQVLLAGRCHFQPVPLHARRKRAWQANDCPADQTPLCPAILPAYAAEKIKRGRHHEHIP